MICGDMHVSTSGIFWKEEACYIKQFRDTSNFLKNRVFKHFFLCMQNQKV